MAIRNRGGKWHFRFNQDGKEYAGTTGLAATKQNANQALRMEWECRQALREGRRPSRRIVVREFAAAAKEFLAWAEGHYNEHPNSYKRVVTSFASLKEFFGVEPVSLIDAGRVEAYKTWRTKEHKVRSITLRHDLHALSKFFGYAIKQHWTRENSVHEVDIPSDADAVRMYIFTATEEKEYFKRARKSKNLHDCGRLILNQGIRPDEAVNLRKEHIDLERGTLRIAFGKTPAARRTLNLTAETRVISVAAWRDPLHGFFRPQSAVHNVTSNGSTAHTIVCVPKRRRTRSSFVLCFTICGTPLLREWRRRELIWRPWHRFSATTHFGLSRNMCIRPTNTRRWQCYGLNVR